MKPVAPTFAVAIVAALTLQAASAATCKRITDDTSKFASFLRSNFDINADDMDDLLTALEPVHDVAPWLSTCVAAIDPMAIYSTATMSSAYKACEASIKNFELPENIDDKWLRKTACPFYGETAMPCINNVGVQVVLDAMAGAGTCCDAMKTQLQTWFGTDIKTMVANLLAKAGATVCTIKTFKDDTNAMQSESCVWSAYQSFMTEGAEDYWRSMVQMPTTEVCKAIAGDSFKTTQRKVVYFDWADQNVENFGICYEPLSELFKHVGAYPIVAMPMSVDSITMSMADVFASGDNCMLIDNALKWAQNPKNMVMQWAQRGDDLAPALNLYGSTAYNLGLTSYRDQNLTSVVDQYIEYFRDDSDMSSMCVHLATGQKCDYNGATTTLAYQTATPAPSTTNTTNTTTTTKNAAGSLLLGVAIAITTVASLSSL